MKNSDDKIKKIINLMNTDDSVDAPEDAIKWSKNLFRTRSAEQGTSGIRRIIGVLLQELSPDTPAFGERSASAGKVRQLLYEAGDNRVDLRVSPRADAFDVRGQVLGTGWEGAIVEFAGQRVAIDRFGSFLIKGVGREVSDLTIKGENVEIVLSGIELG